jgi:hypothetical protein
MRAMAGTPVEEGTLRGRRRNTEKKAYEGPSGPAAQASSQQPALYTPPRSFALSLRDHMAVREKV